MVATVLSYLGSVSSRQSSMAQLVCSQMCCEELLKWNSKMKFGITSPITQTSTLIAFFYPNYTEVLTFNAYIIILI